ncbi:ABC1 kinase family protein [Mesobacillus maritimus]|uniref:ABC1 kinase family protein n=1 Tax=Mesobacillus maritimus TaxID=1643336 RepID=UPI00384CF6D4
MITSRLRQLNRYREIVSLIAKYGYGYIIEEIGLRHLLTTKDKVILDFKEGNVKDYGSRLRSLIEELGPTFIKIGQLLSIRSDFLPAEMLLELEDLQDRVATVPISEIKETIIRELGYPVEEIFQEFNDDCVAAASIGQVHSAVLKTGEKVMVKVQRSGIHKVILTDLEILKDLSVLLEKRYKIAKDYHLSAVVNEISKSIKKELDYMQEARNTETVKTQFEGHNRIKVPTVYWDYTTSKILTIDAMPGVKITDRQITSMPIERKSKVADLLVEAFVRQIFVEGFFHADPHPGNLLYDCDREELALIDFGQIGRLTARMRFDATTLLIGLMKEDSSTIVKAIYRLAEVPPTLDESQFYDDIERIRKKYIHIPLGELNLGIAVQEVFSAAQHHNIIINSDLTMTAKTLITVEGIVKEIDPEINLLTLAKPYGEKLLIDRYNPANMGKRILENAETFSDSLTTIPGRMERLIDKLVEGEMKVDIRLLEMKELLRKFDRSANLVSFSLSLVALSIILLGMIIGKSFGEETFLTKIPIIEIGLAVAVVMFLRILYSIIRSGRF